VYNRLTYSLYCRLYFVLFSGVCNTSPLPVLINRVYLPIGVESVVDFISAISELSIISKESTLFHVVVEACNGLRSLIIWDTLSPYGEY